MNDPNEKQEPAGLQPRPVNPASPENPPVNVSTERTGQLSPNLMNLPYREVTPTPQSYQDDRGQRIDPNTMSRGVQDVEKNLEQIRGQLKGQEQSLSREDYHKEMAKKLQQQYSKGVEKDRSPDR